MGNLEIKIEFIGLEPDFKISYPEDDYMLIRKRGNQFDIPYHGSKDDVEEVLKIWETNQENQKKTIKRTPSNIQASQFILVSKKEFEVFFESLGKTERELKGK